MRIKVNEDKELVKEIREQIKRNDGHCCCAIIFDDDNLCMCKAFRDQIAEKIPGFCDCGLYEFVTEESDSE